MFDWAGRLLGAGRPLIVEANFTASAAPLFDRLPPHRTVQLFCTAPREVVIERYAARVRHGGHLDDVVLEELRAGRHAEQWEPVPLPGELHRLDAVTSEVDGLLSRVRDLLGPA